MKDALNLPALAEALISVYQGEYMGEMLFETLLERALTPEQNLAGQVMLQWETETKARLRVIVAALGLSVNPNPDMLAERRIHIREAWGHLTWDDAMIKLADDLRNVFLPRYRGYTEEARGYDFWEDALDSMIEHEILLLSLVEGCLSGNPEIAIKAINAKLSYPIGQK